MKRCSFIERALLVGAVVASVAIKPGVGACDGDGVTIVCENAGLTEMPALTNNKTTYL